MPVYISGQRKTHRRPQYSVFSGGAFDLEALDFDVDVKVVGCSVDVTHSHIYLLFSTRRPILWIGILLTLVLLSTFTFTCVTLRNIRASCPIGKILTLVDHRNNVLRVLENLIELLI
jgi:hypothetical protein